MDEIKCKFRGDRCAATDVKTVAEDRHIICDKTKRIKKEEIEIGLRKDSSVATDLKKAISRSLKK